MKASLFSGSWICRKIATLRVWTPNTGIRLWRRFVPMPTKTRVSPWRVWEAYSSRPYLDWLWPWSHSQVRSSTTEDATIRPKMAVDWMGLGAMIRTKRWRNHLGLKTLKLRAWTSRNWLQSCSLSQRPRSPLKSRRKTIIPIINPQLPNLEYHIFLFIQERYPSKIKLDQIIRKRDIICKLTRRKLDFCLKWTIFSWFLQEGNPTRQIDNEFLLSQETDFLHVHHLFYFN